MEAAEKKASGKDYKRRPDTGMYHRQAKTP